MKDFPHKLGLLGDCLSIRGDHLCFLGDHPDILGASPSNLGDHLGIVGANLLPTEDPTDLTSEDYDTDTCCTEIKNTFSRNSFMLKEFVHKHGFLGDSSCILGDHSGIHRDSPDFLENLSSILGDYRSRIAVNSITQANQEQVNSCSQMVDACSVKLIPSLCDIVPVHLVKVPTNDFVPSCPTTTGRKSFHRQIPDASAKY